MKKGFFVSVLFASALVFMLGTSSALAATRVYVSVAPPPLVVETVPVAPGPNQVWVPGFHRWDGHAYVWVKGHYVVAPRPHAVWVAGHWGHHHTHGWYWVDGHWR